MLNDCEYYWWLLMNINYDWNYDMILIYMNDIMYFVLYIVCDMIIDWWFNYWMIDFVYYFNMMNYDIDDL